MTELLNLPLVARGFEVLGVAAACIFYGRFYLQWIVSERRGASVVPIGFWYMSAVGSLLLLTYAAYTQSPVGALSHSFNIVIYARNLVHIWRERGELSARRHLLTHTAMGLVVFGALALLCTTWIREYGVVQEAAPETARHILFWLAVGAAGQGLFACRFIVQWIATERKRKSVMPTAFWYISLAAAVLLMSSHFHRPEREWVFVVGVSTTIPIYLRNLWLIRRKVLADAAVA